MIGCDCETCRAGDVKDRRWRSSAYIQLDDGSSLLLDASPDLRAQALRFDVPRVDFILLTHSHADHVLGLDDVRVYNMRQGRSIPCYGDARTIEDVRRMFAYVFDPRTPRGGGLPQLTLWPLAGAFCVAHRTVIPIPLRHGTLPILGYRLGAFAYLTDCNEIPTTSWPLLHDLDVLVLDALRHRSHPTHFNLEGAVAAAKRINAQRTYFTHMTHDLPHVETCESLPDRMCLAHDGLVFEVAEQTNETAVRSSVAARL